LYASTLVELRYQEGKVLVLLEGVFDTQALILKSKKDKKKIFLRDIKNLIEFF